MVKEINIVQADDSTYIVRASEAVQGGVKQSLTTYRFFPEAVSFIRGFLNEAGAVPVQENVKRGPGRPKATPVEASGDPE